MIKYLKLFETTSDYKAYINGEGVVLPNVSVAKDAPKTVYYNPIPPFFVKLSLNNGEVVELQGSGQLTSTMVSPYRSSLVSAEIGELCTSIGDSAFESCSGLTSITIPDSVTRIDDYAFYECSYLTSITIPNSVTSIGDGAFDSCSSLTSITIPNSVTSIGNSAFSNCTGLTSVTIPNSVTSIGEIAFIGCTGLTSIIVDSANTVYDSRDNCNAIINTSTNELIAGCNNTIIPNTVTSIGENAFSGCTGLTSITIPDSVIGIGDSAFSYCSGLTSITIPDRVTSIGKSAFNYCKGLTSVTIPNSVTSIGKWAFSHCTGITSITCNATTAPTIQSNTFQNVKTGGTLTVPSGSTGYNVWMGTGNYYLGKYNWRKVEQ